jgi:hypothetical protein
MRERFSGRTNVQRIAGFIDKTVEGSKVCRTGIMH